MCFCVDMSVCHVVYLFLFVCVCVYSWKPESGTRNKSSQVLGTKNLSLDSGRT